MNKVYNIAISCIGSGVGQSVINSCRLSKLPIKIFGFGTNPLAYGLYDCDEYAYTPNIYQNDYVDQLIEICKKYEIDLIIPGMDDEAHIFSRNVAKFNEANIKVIVAGEDLLSLCRDKEKMSNELNKINNVFVKSFDKVGFIKALEENEINFPVIAKPRGGFASRGIEIISSTEDINKITEDHIVQELAIPHKSDPERLFYESQLKKNINPQVSEISIQIVADQNGDIIGRMISYNKLNNGVPVEILPIENEYIWNEVDKLYPTFKKMGLRGPFNLQGRLTDEGLKLFELNARFTGITGLRAYMGFNEVEACLKEWLKIDSENNNLILNHNKFGIRQTADKSIYLGRNPEVKKLTNLINRTTLKNKKNILITGATGYLGRNLIDKLISENHPFEIWALVRDLKKAQEILPESVICFTKQDLLNGNLSLGNVDILLHAAFSRPHCSHVELAQSLEFTADLFKRAVSNQVANIINISSQAVYGQGSLPPWSETSEVVPNSPYGTAKYATELLLSNLAYQHNHIHTTSIRLGALTGGAKGLVEIDILSKLVAKSIKSEPIQIVGGMQILERMDVRDAIDGIITLLNANSDIWKPIYNLGSSKPVKLIDLAQLVVEVVSEQTNIPESTIEVEDKMVEHKFGLNSSLFYNDFKWEPKYTLEDSIKSLINFYQK